MKMFRSIVCIALALCYLVGLACMLWFSFGLGVLLWATSTVGGAYALYEIRRREDRKKTAEEARQPEKEQ